MSRQRALSVDEVNELLADVALRLSLDQVSRETVIMRGSLVARRTAMHILLEAGLSVAPYPEADHWCWA